MISKEIKSLQHPLVKYCVSLRKERAFRYEERAVLLSGNKQILEVASHTPLKILIAQEGFVLPSFLKAEECFFVPFALLEKITGLAHPEPLAAIVPMPPFHSLAGKQKILALDGLADPGNLGTLLRTALALGWEGAFITKESTDPFNEKALRSAKGAAFRLPLALGSFEELKTLIEKNHWHAYVADSKGEAVDKKIGSFPCVLILGNEAKGPDPFAKEHYTMLSIPMKGEMESLNVASAGAILMYAFGKKI